MSFGESYLFYLKSLDEKYYRVSIYEEEEKTYYYRPQYKKFRYCIRIIYDKRNGSRFRKLDVEKDKQNKARSPFYKRIGKPRAGYDPYYVSYYDKFEELTPETPEQFLEVLGLEDCEYISEEEYIDAIFSSIKDISAPEDYVKKERRYPHDLKRLLMIAMAGGKPSQRSSAMKRILKWGDQAIEAYNFMIEHGMQETMFGALILATKYKIPGLEDVIKKITDSTDEERVWIEGYSFKFAPIYANLYLNTITNGQYSYIWRDLQKTANNMPEDVENAIKFFISYTKKPDDASGYSFGYNFKGKYKVEDNNWLLIPEYLKNKTMDEKYEILSNVANGINLIYDYAKLHYLFRTPFKIAELGRFLDLFAFIIHLIDRDNCTCGTCAYLRRRAKRVLKEWGREKSEDYVKTLTLFFALQPEWIAPSYYSNRYKWQLFYNRRLIRDFLYGKSQRSYWSGQLVRGDAPDILSDELWQTREEFFPELWNEYPNYVWWLLGKTKVAAILDFCLRVLGQSDKGKEFLNSLNLKDIVSTLEISYDRVQNFFYDILMDRLKKLDKLPEDLIKILVESNGPKAWELAIQLVKDKKAELKEDQFVMLCIRPNARLIDFCRDRLVGLDENKKKNITIRIFELISIEEDVKKINLELINSLIERADLPISGETIVPLLRSKNKLGQNLVSSLIGKESLKAGFLTKEAYISTFENSAAYLNLCKSITQFLEQDIEASTFSLEESIEIISSLLQSPHEEIFLIYDRLSEELISKTPEGSKLLLDGIVKNLIRKEITEKLKETFLELLRKTNIEIWKPIDIKIINALTKLEDPDISIITQLVLKYKTVAMPTKETIDKVVGSEALVIRRYLIDVLNLMASLIDLQTNILTPIIESDFNDLFTWTSEFIRKVRIKEAVKAKYLRKIIDSPVVRVQEFSFNVLKDIFKEKLPYDIILHLLEHPSEYIRGAIAEEVSDSNIFEKLVKEEPDLFLRYIKSVIYLPNKIAKAKDRLYELLIDFAKSSPSYKNNIKDILLKVGGGAIIKDKERALKAYVKIID
ncbi:MAG: hypothetical protein ACFFCM_10700 [Promethearchaeota archaeon]